MTASPKSEVRSPKAQVGASHLLSDPPRSTRASDFGLRTSDFLRTSAFGLRPSFP
jgi:hypothetical protein